MSYQTTKGHVGTLNAYCYLKIASLKGYMLYDSNYMTFWKRQNYGDSKRISDARGSRGNGAEKDK